MKTAKIGIFGHYGNKNLGDEAIIEATIQNLKRLIPSVELIGLSINPDDTHSRYGIESFPIRYQAAYFDRKNTHQPHSENPQQTTETKKQPVNRPFIVRALRAIPSRTYHASRKLVQEIKFLRACKNITRDLDLLIVCGSNQFLDNFGGPWGFPYTLLKWTLIAKSTNTKVAFISIGAGPIYRKLSFKLLTPAIRRADYLSYRDQGSKKLIEENIKGIDGLICPDIAHSLQDNRYKNLSKERKTIAINPMPVYDKRYWYKTDSEKVNHYINTIAKFTVQLIKQNYNIVLFNTQSRDLDSIQDILDRIEKISPEERHSPLLNVDENITLDDLLETFSKSNAVVATRFHATVLPLRLNIPTFGITYYRKAREQLDDIGLNNCYVDIENFTAQELSIKFAEFMDNSESHQHTISHNFKGYSKILDKQWAAVCALINK